MAKKNDPTDFDAMAAEALEDPTIRAAYFENRCKRREDEIARLNAKVAGWQQIAETAERMRDDSDEELDRIKQEAKSLLRATCSPEEVRNWLRTIA